MQTTELLSSEVYHSQTIFNQVSYESILLFHIIQNYPITLSKPPLTMIFCLSGGTPVRSNNWHLKTYGDWVVSISTAGKNSFCHFTLTVKRNTMQLSKTATRKIGRMKCQTRTMEIKRRISPCLNPI